MPQISVIIGTYKRPNKLYQCLDTILKNNFRDSEIIIIEQQGKGKTEKRIENIRKKIVKKTSLHYFNLQERGASRAKDFGIEKAKGEIIAFTDDDCLVDKSWLKNIHTVFRRHKDISGVFGQVLPYEPGVHKREICPATFLKGEKRVINKPCLHWKNIGFGNNMAFKREIFTKIGGFKEWLGPGSIACAAEDGELALRGLLNSYQLLYSPEVKVYHNRWLTKEEFRKQCLSYSSGEVACYGYLAFQGHKLGKKVLKNNFLDSWGKLKFSLKSILLFKKNSLQLLCHTLQELCFRLRGLVVASWFSKKEPLNFTSLLLVSLNYFSTFSEHFYFPFF